jgi:hypothetical protein
MATRLEPDDVSPRPEPGGSRLAQVFILSTHFPTFKLHPLVAKGTKDGAIMI